MKFAFVVGELALAWLGSDDSGSIEHYAVPPLGRQLSPGGSQCSPGADPRAKNGGRVQAGDVVNVLGK